VVLSKLALTKTSLQAGVWHGVLTGAGEMPRLSVTHHNREVPGISVLEAKDAGTWLVQVPVPVDLISDGVQTLVVSEESTGEMLQSITLLAGDVLDDDLRAEVDILRAELELLKRTFRRHCTETD
jgi:hypothetical protein